MVQSQFLKLVAVAVIAVAAMGAWAQDEPARGKQDQADKTAMACGECMAQCAKAMKHCVRQLVEGKKEHAKCLELLADCMAMTAATAKCCQGPTAATACAACAKICEQCAAECERLGDAELKATAKACRDCAKMCHMMMKHKPGKGAETP